MSEPAKTPNPTPGTAAPTGASATDLQIKFLSATRSFVVIERGQTSAEIPLPPSSDRPPIVGAVPSVFQTEGDTLVLLGDALPAADDGNAGEVQHALRHALLGWHDQSLLNSARECAQGGLVAALVESCVVDVPAEAPKTLGATVDLSSIKDTAVTALLFGEGPGRFVVTASAQGALKILGQARALGIPAVSLGKVGGAELRIKTTQGEFAWALADLRGGGLNPAGSER